jgi:hypothetical protein
MSVLELFSVVTARRFVPPEDFNLALLSLELEFIKKGTKIEQVIFQDLLVLPSFISLYQLCF